MTSQEQRRAKIAQELAEVRAYRNAEPIKRLLNLLDALIDEHRFDLIQVTPDQLQLTQGAVRQLMCLANAITQEGVHLSPKM